MEAPSKPARRRKRFFRAAKDKSVGAIQCSPSGILKVFFRRIDYRKIQAWFQELQQGIAFQNKRRRFSIRCRLRFLDRGSQQWKSLCKKTLLRAKPEGAARACSKKPRTVRSSIRVDFPIERTNMLRRRAITVLSVSCADAVAILRDFSSDPILIGKSGNHVANELRLPDASRVTADDNYSPAR